MKSPLRTLALGLALALSFAGGAQAAEPAPAVMAVTAAAPAVQPKPSLWKIADADTTIWLFGTIHALPPGIDWLHGPIETALDSSDQLVTEIPETSGEEMKAAMLASAMLPPRQSLRALLAAKQRTKFDTVMARFGLPPAAFDRFEPWYGAIALVGLELQKTGYSGTNGIEETLSAAARAKGKPRIGLETAAQQLAMFHGLPLAVQKKYLGEVLDDLPKVGEELDEMVREWSAGHAEKLAELVNSDQDDPHMVATLITNRNKAWAGWIGQRLDQPGTVFVAVGAGHLAGKDSVQTFLSRRGVTVTRVQ